MPHRVRAILHLLALFAAFGFTEARAAELPLLDLQAGKDAPSLTPYVRYARNLGDPAVIGLDRLLGSPLVPIRGQATHFGPPGTKTTALLRVRNAGDKSAAWIFTTGRGSLKYFRLYEVQDGRLDLTVDGADAASASRNLRTYQAFSSELVLDPGQEKILVIDFLSENSTYMPLRIETYGSFFKARRENIAMVSGVVIAVVVLILLNFLFFSITGHREFIWLAIAQAFFALNTVHSEGYFTIFFLADSPLLGVAIEEFFKCGFAAAMAQFGRSFVGTRQRFPKRDLVLRTLIGAALAIMLLQPGLWLYPPGLRSALHIGGWFVAVAVALFLPFIGVAAMKQLGRQLWPLFVGWGSLAAFIIYAAVASMGIFSWLPINWHLSGPVGLFESLMVTLALGLNLKKIQRDKLEADSNYARSMEERVAISEQAARLAKEKAFALETVNSQNALLHASGHDSRQVILALNSAIGVLKRGDGARAHGELTAMLQSSADYLNQIVSTTISGANIVGDDTDFLALSSFRAQALVEPLAMMFRAPFAGKKLTLTVQVEGEVTLVSDKPLLMRALANLLSNCYHYADRGGASLTIGTEASGAAIHIRDSGRGMPPAIMHALNGDDTGRLRGHADVGGTGSGFRSAKRLIERLSGSLEILSSDSSGTLIRILLPCAWPDVTPCDAETIQAGLPDWQVLDFDQRAAFETGLAAATVAKRQIIALSYDDTTVTRSRLRNQVGLMIIKPICRELLGHPVFAARSQNV